MKNLISKNIMASKKVVNHLKSESNNNKKVKLVFKKISKCLKSLGIKIKLQTSNFSFRTKEGTI